MEVEAAICPQTLVAPRWPDLMTSCRRCWGSWLLKPPLSIAVRICVGSGRVISNVREERYHTLQTRFVCSAVPLRSS